MQDKQAMKRFFKFYFGTGLREFSYNFKWFDLCWESTWQEQAHLKRNLSQHSFQKTIKYCFCGKKQNKLAQSKSHITLFFVKKHSKSEKLARNWLGNALYIENGLSKGQWFNEAAVLQRTKSTS